MTERVKYLEGLRGLAAFTVFLGHFIPLYIRIALLMSLAYIGREVSVCIFFVLSGFVLTYAFFSTTDYETLVSGAVRRYIRLIIPVLFLLVLLFFIVYPGVGNHFNPKVLVDMTSTAFWGVFLQSQLSYSPEVLQYTALLWTIAIEFIGSFIVFAFAALFGQLRNRWIFYLVALVVFLNTYYLAFILGMILADIYGNRSGTAVRCSNPLIASATLIIAVVLMLYPLDFFGIGMYSGIAALTTMVTSGAPFVGTTLFQIGGSLHSGDFIRIIGAFILLFALLNAEWLKSALSARIPVFLGKISFSLYLIHMLVILEFSSFVMGAFIDGPVNPASGTFILILTLPVLLGASYLMYRYIDHPGTILSKKVYYRLFRNDSGTLSGNPD